MAQKKKVTRKRAKRKPIKKIVAVETKHEAIEDKKVDDMTENDGFKEPEIQTGMMETPPNRMMKYKKNPACPECKAHPTVCRQRRPGYSQHRCRVCGHQFSFGSIGE